MKKEKFQRKNSSSIDAWKRKKNTLTKTKFKNKKVKHMKRKKTLKEKDCMKVRNKEGEICEKKCLMLSFL